MPARLTDEELLGRLVAFDSRLLPGMGRPEMVERVRDACAATAP